MRFSVLPVLVLSLAIAAGLAAPPAPVAIPDYTNYNIGQTVRIRLHQLASGRISIRYAGEKNPTVADVSLAGDTYRDCWTIPENARTGLYQVDLQTAAGEAIQNIASFAVHRQRAKVLSVELDKTFYTSGDSVNPTILVRNISAQPLRQLQIEFEAYTYPWIAPSPDDPPAWKTIVSSSLSLQPGEEKIFHVNQAAVVQAPSVPVTSYYCVVIRDSRSPDRIYDLAFAPPAFVVPPAKPLPKQYPILYLYEHLADLPKSEAYRNFYPPRYVSDVIRFDASHTMFPLSPAPEFDLTISQSENASSQKLTASVFDDADRLIQKIDLQKLMSGPRHFAIAKQPAGLYKLRVEIVDSAGNVTAHNQLEFAVNRLPKSILMFCAHQDDDTAHPGLIRAATENHIPIHVVYLTSGDAGGCDRFYMHSCDAARALDFGEVRMQESRASLAHLGIDPANISFLGLPDGGMEQIWFDHVRDSDPYLSVLLASEHSPYRDAAIPNLPFSRDAVVLAAKTFITRFHPDLIVTGHPDERHVDHRVNNWIVVKAMQELAREGKLPRETRLLVDVVYGAQPGPHAPYRFEKDHLFVSGEAAKLGQEASWFYQSQDGNHQQAAIVSFDKLPREEPFPHYRILDWYDHEGWNEKRPSP